MQEAQRYPADFDGIVVGSPVIDEVPTNSFYHGWNVHVNSDANQQAILTADKIPTLVSFVQSSCADKGGLIQDPRACKPDLTKIQCPNGTNTAQCLTAAQISVVQAGTPATAMVPPGGVTRQNSCSAWTGFGI